MKLNGIVSKLFVLFFILVLSACSTRDAGAEYRSEITIKEYNQDYFRSLLNEKSYQKAFNEYHSLYPGGVSGEGWEEIKNETLLGMKESFNLALDKLDYDKSFSLMNSFSHDEGIHYLDFSLEELNLSYLEYLMENNYTGAVGTWFLDSLEKHNLSEEQLLTLQDYFINNNLFSPLQDLALIIEERDLAISPEAREMLNRKIKKKDMLDGTVTIWVNRGIKLENGMGYPDRVIGSGFFIDPNGYILTNYHVISSEVDPTYEGYSRLYIKLSENENERIPATVVGWDPVLDLALLKTEISSTYSFSFNRDDYYEIGDEIFAIGSPGGLTNSVTSGTISNMGRNLQALGESLQIDVPINPGNSGGPLLNQQGEVIGIVYAGIDTYDGVNFAIPASYVKDILPRLYEGGQIEYSWLGAVAYEDFNKLINRYTVPGTNAELSQLLEGDTILAVNGTPVYDVTDVQDLLISARVNELVMVDIKRNGESLSIPIGLQKRPEYPMETLLDRDSIDNLYAPIFGMKTVRINSKRTARQYRVEEVFPGSISDESGLVTGDSFTLKQWINQDEEKILMIQIMIKARKSGFMQSGLQLGSWYNVNYFI